MGHMRVHIQHMQAQLTEHKLVDMTTKNLRQTGALHMRGLLGEHYLQHWVAWTLQLG